MKKHRNTLYITSSNAFIRKEGDTFVVEIDNKKTFQAPVFTIQNIVCFGYKPVTPSLMAYCSENGISISYLSSTGKFLARVYGAQTGNVMLRTKQYQISDSEEESLKISKNIVVAKIKNSRNLILRHIRNHGGTQNMKDCSILMARSMNNAEIASSLDELRGYEGESASIYFSCFNDLIVSQKDDFVFKIRTRRPPLDKVNALLSFLYVIVTNDIRSALEVVGIDPQVGFLHSKRSGRPSLALDIVEEFRSYIAERLVLTLINRKQISKSDFEKRETGEIRIKDKGRREILMAYQRRKDEVIMHPLLDEKTTIGLLFHIQAMFLARYIRGEIDAYPPFFIK